MTARFPRWALWATGTGFALAAALLTFWTARNTGFDDSFITYVYARSFAAGHGLTWPGSQGLGTSTPFLAVILGGLSRLSGIEVPLLGAAIGWISIALASFGLVALGNREGWPWGGLAAGILWFFTRSSHTLIGNEYLPAIAAVVWAFYARSRGRLVATGVLLALAAMFRAEAGLAAPILAALELRRQSLGESAKRIGRIAAVAAVLAGLWLAILYGIAGTIVPQTLHAKRAQAESRLNAWSPTFGLVTALAEPSVVFPGWRHAWWLPLALAGGAALVVRRREIPPSAFALLVWGFAHVALIAALRISFMPWYIAPLRFAQLLLPAFAVEAPALLGARWRWAWSLAATAALALVVWSTGREIGWLCNGPIDLRRLSYGDVAAFAARYPPGTRLAAWEVGFLGWSSTHPVVDLLGLTSESASLDAVRRGDLRENLDRLHSDLVMVALQSSSLIRATEGEPRSFLAAYRLDRLQPLAKPPLAVYRRATLPPRGEVAIDLLGALPPGVGVRYHQTGDMGLLAIPIRPGDQVTLAVPAGGKRPFSALLTAPRQRSRLVVRIDAGNVHKRFRQPLTDTAWSGFDIMIPATEGGASVTFQCAKLPPRGCLVGQPYLGYPVAGPPERRPHPGGKNRRQHGPRGPHEPQWVP